MSATLHRARHALGVVIERDESSEGRPSIWRLPADDEPPEGYVSPGLIRNPMTRNQQRPDQGKHPESDHYVSRVDDDTKPLKTALSVRTDDDDERDVLTVAEDNVRAAFSGSVSVDEDEDQ